MGAPVRPNMLNMPKSASEIALSSPESVLPDVLAIHTIEMIPTSMILVLQFTCNTTILTTLLAREG